MASLVKTYQLIADILSFEYPIHKLEQKLKDHDINWDLLVVEGSKHLILPALYCRLKSKNLLSSLPSELENYLKELSAINGNRNNSILDQVKFISKLLNKNTIEHVFLKGGALLASGIYEDNAERMIGDIDILISKSQINDAFVLLLGHGYKETPKTLGNTFFEHKHLPRLMPKEAICAVELHEKLFTNYEFKPLNPDNILNQKRVIDGINIPSSKALLFHNVLNFQINDNGKLYNSINYRAAYDTLALINFNKDICSYKSLKTGHFLSYFRYLSLFFNEVSSILDIHPNVYSHFYFFKLKNRKFYKFWTKLLNVLSFIRILVHRFYIFIINKNYRNAIIADRARIIKHLKSYSILRGFKKIKP